MFYSNAIFFVLIIVTLVKVQIDINIWLICDEEEIKFFLCGCKVELATCTSYIAVQENIYNKNSNK